MVTRLIGRRKWGWIRERERRSVHFGDIAFMGGGEAARTVQRKRTDCPGSNHLHSHGERSRAGRDTPDVVCVDAVLPGIVGRKRFSRRMAQRRPRQI